MTSPPTRQLSTVLWEHYKIRKHHFILTTLEVFLPIAAFVFVAYARSELPRFDKQYVNATYPFQLTDELLSYAINIRDTNIFFAPNTEFTDDLVRQVQLKLNLYNEGIKGFRSREDILKYYKETGDEGITVILTFDNVGHIVPRHLKYDVQMYENGIDWQTEKLFRYDINYMQNVGSERYIGNQFIPVQWAIDTSFIEMVTKETFNVSMTFQEFPYPPHWTDNGMNDVFIHLLPLLTIMSFIFLFPSILKVLVQEKSSGMKQLMKINGLKAWAYWIGWFINGFSLCVISSIAIVFLLTTKIFHANFAPLEHADVAQLTALILLYCSATISFIFAFSILFNKAILAVIFGMIFWFILYITYVGIAINVDVLSVHFKMAISLIPNIALYYGFSIIAVGEIRGKTVEINEKPRSSGDDVTMMYILFMLAFNTVFYMMVAWFFESDPTGLYKISKYYQNAKNKIQNKFKNGADSKTQDETSILIDNNVEDDNSPVLLSIQNLTKTYGNVKAIDNFSIKLYEGSTTALLGKNGAGKTTTMSILAGLIQKTSGTILLNSTCEVNFKDRQLISICPQDNLLFPELSVEEHLQYFAMLKGLTKEETKNEIENLLKDKLKLNEKKNELISNLSGGMKRKLSIGIAILGKPKILILDEPTAGIDPDGRRAVWDLILKCKGETTILMSTHLMEEAEELADRIAIINHGRLECHGTMMFLRNLYGLGYRLSIQVEDDYNLEEINKLVKEELNVDSPSNCKQGFLQYLFDNTKQERVPSLMERINKRKKLLSIIDYDLSSVTLEEIFCKISNIYTKEAISPKDVVKAFVGAEPQHTPKTSKATKLSCWDFPTKLLLILEKKYVFFLRTYVNWLTMVAIFYLLIFLTFFLGDNGFKDISVDGKALNIHLGTYGSSNVYYSINKDEMNVKRIYETLVRDWSGTTEKVADVSEAMLKTEIENIAKYRTRMINNDQRDVERIYETLVRDWSGTTKKVADVSEAILKTGIENIVKYRTRMIVAAEFTFEGPKLDNVNVMYSNQAIHGAPISLNLVTNTLVKYLGGDEHSITATNTPLRSVNTKTQSTTQSTSENLFLWITLLPLGSLLLVVVFTFLPTVENISLVKTLSNIYKLNSHCYWMNSYISDILFYVVIIMPVIAVLSILSSTGALSLEYVGIENLFYIYILYGFTIIPFIYLISTFSKSVPGAFATLVVPNMCLSPILAGVVLTLEMTEETSAGLLRNGLSFNPHFTLTYLLSKFCIKMVENHNWDIKTPDQIQLICEEKLLPCCDRHSTECHGERAYVKWDDYIWGTVGAAILCLLLVIFLDSDLPKRIEGRNRFVKPIRKAMQTRGSVPALIAHNVKKHYKKYFLFGKIKAVENLNFTAFKGECFGLLGLNGAGKSTTFRMITKQELPTEGEFNIDEDTTIGYCPQDHAMIEALSGRELLDYFAKLRNVTSPQDEITNLMQKCGLEEYANRPCGTYSGGNKRKLNTCIALIGDPHIIALDEPTTGVDPESRKKIQDLVEHAKGTKMSSVIFTSHSMDECERLCDSVAIMKDGKIKDQGKTNVLRNKYGVGHIVTIKWQPPESEDAAPTKEIAKLDLKTKFKRTFSSDSQSDNKETNEKLEEPVSNQIITQLEHQFAKTNVEVIEKRNGHVCLCIRSYSWEEIFGTMEAFKVSVKSLVIEYAVKESSLQQIFLKIAHGDSKY